MGIMQSGPAPETGETAENVYVGYRMVIEPCGQRIRAEFNGEIIADSVNAMVMQETRLPQVFYFPREDVRMDLLTRTDNHTYCPFKGNASYWTVKVGKRSAGNAAWSYEDAYDEAAIVKDYISFYWDRMDRWIAGDEELEAQPGADKSEKTNPLVNWLVHEAWKPKSAVDQIESLAGALVQAGFPLWSMRLFIRTLNPQLFARFYSWRRDEDEVIKREATHAGIQSEQYLNSPFALIINGEGGVRRQLEGDNPRLDFPILEDLIEEGATDYVAVPLKFSDGQINVLTLISDAPGGFTTGQLGHLYEILPNLGRLFEARAQRVSAMTLLQTYLGRSAGERVSDGLVQRGDGEELHAVILFSDLRRSTAMAEMMTREDYLAALNQYFDCVAGAVIEQGGEVLKFIGDAVLAIFPVEDQSALHPAACEMALGAVQAAKKQLAEINLEREAEGMVPLKFGIALHRGTITYGNVGTDRRLDFTVIGPAVNEAARIESLCKTLDETVLMSADFAEATGIPLKSLGTHPLRGVQSEEEIFTFPAST